MTTRRPTGVGGYRAISAVLFLCLFAGQAGTIALSPVLAEVAADLDVSTALAGQLRTIAGLVAAVTALALGRLGARVGLGRQLLAGSILLAVGSLASAAAPGIGLLAAAQIPVGAAIGILTTAGTLAAAEWVPAERRTATLSWALIGQPAAWIVGMPLLGVAGEQSWRYAWLVFPARRRPARRGRGGRPQQRTAGASGAGILACGARSSRTATLARGRGSDEHRLGRNARLLGGPLRRVVRSVHRADGRRARPRRRRIRLGQPRTPPPHRARAAATALRARLAARGGHCRLRRAPSLTRRERGALRGGRLRSRRADLALERFRPRRTSGASPGCDGAARSLDAVRLLHRFLGSRCCACLGRLRGIRRDDRHPLPLGSAGAPAPADAWRFPA